MQASFVINAISAARHAQENSALIASLVGISLYLIVLISHVLLQKQMLTKFFSKLMIISVSPRNQAGLSTLSMPKFMIVALLPF